MRAGAWAGWSGAASLTRNRWRAGASRGPMKTSPKLMLALATLGLAPLTSLVLAQEADADAPPPPPAAGEREPGHHPMRGPRGDRLKMLTEKLDLTADQQAKVKAILDDSRKQMQAARKDDATAKAEKQEKGMEIMVNANKQIRAVLTPEQQAKFDKMLERRREHWRKD